MPNLDLSVVVPTHNRRELLMEMLEALAGQTLSFERFEVIVSIDGSSDNSYESLRDLETPYSLVVLRQSQSGVSVARNRGARAAKGAVLLFLDDDVLPDPRLLEEHMRTQTDNPRGVVLGRLLPAAEGRRRGWNVWEDGVLAKHYREMSRGSRPPIGRRLYSGNFSVPREPFLRLGGFNESLRRGEDTELGFRLEQAGVPFYFNEGASAVHRGYRDFSSWCASAYEYGRIEVHIAARKDPADGLNEVFERYAQRRSAVHWAVRLSLGRWVVRESMTHALRLWAGALSGLGLHGLAHLGYSMIFNLKHWSGVADELGGRGAFNQSAANSAPFATPISPGQAHRSNSADPFR